MIGMRRWENDENKRGNDMMGMRQGMSKENDCSYKVATAPTFDTGGDLGFNEKWICIK